MRSLPILSLFKKKQDEFNKNTPKKKVTSLEPNFFQFWTTKNVFEIFKKKAELNYKQKEKRQLLEPNI